MIDFSNNINFIGPPAGYDALFNAKDFLKYPDHEQISPRQVIAEKYQIKPEHVALTVGATEALSITARLAIGYAGGLCPSFWEYEHFYTKYHSAEHYKKLHLSNDDDFKFNIRAFDQLVKNNSISTFYIANPNNPTTTLFDKKMLLDLICRYPHILFVLDETYLMFAADYWERTLIQEATSLPNLIVITSMSKIFSLPGLRIGFSVSNSSYMEKFRNMIIPYGVSHLSQIYVSWLIEQDDFLSAARNRYATQSNELKELIRDQLSQNATVYASSAPYFLIKINHSKMKAVNLSNFLKNKNIIVRGGGEFDSLDDSWVRVSIKDTASNNELVKNIDAFLKCD